MPSTSPVRFRSNSVFIRVKYAIHSCFFQQVQAAVSVPIAPLPNGTLMTCSKCFRLNNADARFCDWCGVKPERTSIPLECTKCRSENDPYAKFCTTCGCVIEPPLRIIHARIRNDLTISPSLMIPGVSLITIRLLKSL